MTHNARPTDLPARDGTYVLGPATSTRRSIYSVSDRRDGELLLRLVGLLCRPGVVLVREQALPGDTWMAAELFVPFDMRSVVRPARRGPCPSHHDRGNHRRTRSG